MRTCKKCGCDISDRHHNAKYCFRCKLEQRRSSKNKWDEKNQRKIKDKDHRYYLKNKEKILKYNKDWQNDNPEKMKGYYQSYRAKNISKCREYALAYYHKNLEKCRAKMSDRRRLRSATKFIQAIQAIQTLKETTDERSDVDAQQ